jgi:citrate lyase subunit beta/citryl-CoA lyase
VIRSLLFVPADSERFVAKAHERGADVIILDLEDGVAPAAKDAARAALAAAVPTVSRGGAQAFVRVNVAPDRLEADVAAAFHAGAAALLLPKASVALVRQVTDQLDALERQAARAMLLVPVMEDPGAVLDARAIAQASPRVLALICGGEDLATSMGAEPTPQTLHVPKLLVHLAAKAAGVLSIGLLRSIAEYQDLPGVAEAAREARRHGFDGATCVHPSVVAALNQAFTPDAHERDRARRLVDAFDAARAQGRAAFAFEGVMVDAPAVARARLLLGASAG